jgi:8-oxo-dGTP diphosphatase
MTVSIRLFTVVVLFHEGRLLLLKRAAWKTFFPNRWTGIGGKVEPDELADLESAARRELFEETDLVPSEVSRLTLRRTLTLDRPAEGLLCILYFTGSTTTERIPSCNEGSLQWVTPAELQGLDIIDNSAGVFGRLVGDVQENRSGVRCGIATYEPDGRLVRIVFDE